MAKDYQVFFDFDNTIAKCDTFDGLLPLFSQDNRWVRLEKEWLRGKISSRECLAGQLKGLRLDKKALDRYLAGIKLDPHFKNIVRLLHSRKIKLIILSDNFDYLIKEVLKKNGLDKLKVYSNRLRFSKDRLQPSFPFTNRRCRSCAHCKKDNLLSHLSVASESFYVGDGRSDICPAKYADVVFAKEHLLRHYRSKKINCFAYQSLKDVHDYFKRRLQ